MKQTAFIFTLIFLVGVAHAQNLTVYDDGDVYFRNGFVSVKMND